MILTKKQEEGLKIALERYRKGEKYTCIAGYAGTGKSTLVRFIVKELGFSEKEVCYATYTGKAAQVLISKGNPNACTLHHLLYNSFPISPKERIFKRTPKTTIPYRLVIVDEVSMAPKSIMKDLFNHNIHVIVLGDPFQLPPINEKEDNHLLDNPHIFLDEVMRQAAESEIIRLTMDIREGNPISYMDGKEVKIIPKNQLNAGMLLWADEIITATNQTRIHINSQVRQLLGKGSLPEHGDKVICLKNYWEEEEPLVNGTIGYIQNPYKTFYVTPPSISQNPINLLGCDLKTEDGIYLKGLNLDYNLLTKGRKRLLWNQEYAMLKTNKHRPHIPKEFDYGYAITCHKSQGSEWDKVLVLEEKFPYTEEEHARWLYTACTRASEKLVLVR